MIAITVWLKVTPGVTRSSEIADRRPAHFIRDNNRVGKMSTFSLPVLVEVSSGQK